MKKVARDITVITSELQIALKRETADVIAIGNLLLEAKDQLEHGKWLPWIKANCGLSESTAQNYMNAARLAVKYPTVGVLKLRPTVLYWLWEQMENISLDEIEVIFAVAENEWVNIERAEAIIEAVHEERRGTEDEEEEQPRDEPPVEEQPREEPLRSEIDDILEGPPPELPPAPEVSTPDITLPPFDQAVETLSRLQTKALSSFLGTKHPPDKISMIAHFLRDVADKVQSQAEPAEPRSEQEQIIRLCALWKSGRNKYQSFFAVLHEMNQTIGDEAMQMWCISKLSIGLDIMEKASGALHQVDRGHVKANLKKWREAAR